MHILKTLRVAFRALGKNKLRGGLTVLGVVIGIAAVTTMVSIGQSAGALLQGQIEGLGTNVLVVFGPDRVMVGGDWPVGTMAATFKQWVDALRTVVAHRPAAEQRKLFHDNAEGFYRLG